MIILLTILSVFALTFLFLLAERKETESLALKKLKIAKKTLKNTSVLLFMVVLLVGFMLDATVGVLLVLVNMLCAVLISFYPKKTIFIALILVIPIILFYLEYASK